ncbi:MAG TPA: SLBB domain-containing protein [Gammaproteobacteria bacterium]
MTTRLLPRGWPALLLGLLLAWAAASLHAADEPPLQVGDIVTIVLPGESTFDEPLQLDSEGRIVLPEAGTVRLAGLQRADALEVVRAALAPVYRDLERLDLRVEERRLLVTVLGYVKQPGPVDLPAGATVQMAINAAGGLSQGAQLDKMQLRRGGQVTRFDFKRYLDSGDPAVVPKLQPLDQLFVPASPLTGNVQVEFDAATLTASGDAGEESEAITVFGEVHRPGTFKLRPGASVIDMLMRAGGVTRYAGIEQIRVISKGRPAPFNLRQYLDTGDERLMPGLQSGDTVFVPQSTEAVSTGARTVFIMGEVFKPGAYETEAGASFLDVLANAGGPTRFADTRLIRVLHADGGATPFDLQQFTEGLASAGLPTIRPGDAILVPEKADLQEKSWLKVAPSRAVRIIGAVERPGRYEWSAEMNLMDLLAHAGGPRAEADSAHMQILTARDGGATRVIEFDLKRYLVTAEGPLPEILAGDTVVLPELARDVNDARSQWLRLPQDRAIYVVGQVGAPGRYAFEEGMGFLDVLTAAQGPTGRADLRAVRVTRREGEATRMFNFNLAAYLETGDRSVLPELHVGDVIYLPDRERDWLEISKESTVRVLGAVGAPGRYRFDNQMTILDLLAEAGGPTPGAMQDKIVVVTRARGEQESRPFDLEAFAASGDVALLPPLQPGDTVFVPSREQSAWKEFMRGVTDIVSLLSLVKLATDL